MPRISTPRISAPPPPPPPFDEKYFIYILFYRFYLSADIDDYTEEEIRRKLFHTEIFSIRVSILPIELKPQGYSRLLPTGNVKVECSPLEREVVSSSYQPSQPKT